MSSKAIPLPSGAKLTVFDDLPGQGNTRYGCLTKGLSLPQAGMAYVVEVLDAPEASGAADSLSNSASGGQAATSDAILSASSRAKGKPLPVTLSDAAAENRRVRIVGYVDEFARAFTADGLLAMPPARQPDVSLLELHPKKEHDGRATADNAPLVRTGFSGNDVSGADDAPGFGLKDSGAGSDAEADSDIGNGSEGRERHGIVELRSNDGSKSWTVARITIRKGEVTFDDTRVNLGLNRRRLPLVQATALALVAYCIVPRKEQISLSMLSVGDVLGRLRDGDLFEAMRDVTNAIDAAAKHPLLNPPGLLLYLAHLLRGCGMATASPVSIAAHEDASGNIESISSAIARAFGFDIDGIRVRFVTGPMTSGSGDASDGNGAGATGEAGDADGASDAVGASGADASSGTVSAESPGSDAFSSDLQKEIDAIEREFNEANLMGDRTGADPGRNTEGDELDGSGVSGGSDVASDPSASDASNGSDSRDGGNGEDVEGSGFLDSGIASINLSDLESLATGKLNALPEAVLMRNSGYSNMFYVGFRPDKVSNSGARILISTEAILNRFLLMAGILGNRGIADTATQEQCAELDRWVVEDLIGLSGSTLDDLVSGNLPVGIDLEVDEGIPKDAVPKEDTDLEIRIAFSQACEGLRLPYRMDYRYRFDNQTGRLFIDATCPDASLMPRDAMDPETRDWITLDESDLNAEESRYNAHLAILLAAVGFATSSRVNEVLVNTWRGIDPTTAVSKDAAASGSSNATHDGDGSPKTSDVAGSSASGAGTVSASCPNGAARAAGHGGAAAQGQGGASGSVCPIRAAMFGAENSGSEDGRHPNPEDDRVCLLSVCFNRTRFLNKLRGPGAKSSAAQTVSGDARLSRYACENEPFAFIRAFPHAYTMDSAFHLDGTTPLISLDSVVQTFQVTKGVAPSAAERAASDEMDAISAMIDELMPAIKDLGRNGAAGTTSPARAGSASPARAGSASPARAESAEADDQGAAGTAEAPVAPSAASPDARSQETPDALQAGAAGIPQAGISTPGSPVSATPPTSAVSSASSTVPGANGRGRSVVPGDFAPNLPGSGVETDARPFDAPGSRLLRAQRVSDMGIYEVTPRALLVMEVMNALEHGGATKALATLRDIHDRSENMLVRNACLAASDGILNDRITSEKTDGLKELFSDIYGIRADLRFANKLIQGSDPQRAVEVLENAIARADDSGWFTDSASRVYRYFDSYASRAIYSYRNADELGDRELRLAADEYYLAHHRLALLLMSSPNRAEDAIAHAQRVIELGPSVSASYQLLARSYFSSFDYVSEIDVLKRMLHIAWNPNDVGIALYWLGYAYWMTDKPELGTACYQRCPAYDRELVEPASAELASFLHKEGVPDIENDLLSESKVDALLFSDGIFLDEPEENARFLVNAADAGLRAGSQRLAMSLLGSATAYLRDDALTTVFESIGS